MDKKRKDTSIPFIRSFHAVPFTNANEILPGFFAEDNDLAVENKENDLNFTAADKEDFKTK